MAKVKEIKTFSGPYTLKDVLDNDEDLLAKLDVKPDFLFYTSLERCCLEGKIAAVVARHLGVDKDRCNADPKYFKTWKRGSFNVGIPVSIRDWSRRRVLVRFPIPHKVGEAYNPGNSDEKVRCEAATYLWVHENCPEVNIPRLWGVGLSNGQTFTSVKSLPLWRQLFHACSNWVRSSLSIPKFSALLPDYHHDHDLPAGYIVIDYLEQEDGTMLSDTWAEEKHDTKKREALYRDLSRIMLSLARIPLPRVGAFTLDNRGIIRLANRPITGPLFMMENVHIPSDMSRDCTYSDANLYIRDLLHWHDNRLRCQSNSVFSRQDGRSQMAVLGMMRKTLPDIPSREFRFRLTDLHASNILVDSDWNVRYIIDLEWACSLPLSMHFPPPGPSELNVTDEEGKVNFEGFEHFMRCFENEEKLVIGDHNTLLLTATMEEGKATGTMWYTIGLLLFGLVYFAIIQLRPEFITASTL